MRVLVLDDNPQQAQILQAVFFMAGDRDVTFEAAQYSELDRVLTLDSDWDMALIDIQFEHWDLTSAARLLKQKNGLHALDLLAKRAPSLPAFLHTERATDRLLFENAAFLLHDPSRYPGPRANLLGMVEKPAARTDMGHCFTAAKGGAVHRAVRFESGDLLLRLLANRPDLALWRGLSNGIRTAPKLGEYAKTNGANATSFLAKMVQVLDARNLIVQDLWNQGLEITDTAPAVASFAQQHRPFFWSEHAERVHASGQHRWRRPRARQ